MTAAAKRFLGLVSRIFLTPGLVCCLMIATAGPCTADGFETLKRRLGRHDALILATPKGDILFSHNPDQALVPASTLKLVTALIAFHHLGEDYRFTTEFYLDGRNNLIIKGYGDPLLTSEVVADIADSLSHILANEAPVIQDILVDHTFFGHPVVIPGVTDSSEPYDAPNGALCVNFNTVNFQRINRQFVSAEPQTPLLPMVLERIRASGLDRGRIRLSLAEQEIFFYAGRMFKHFFEAKGIRIHGRVGMGRMQPNDRPVWVYASPFTLEQVVEKMMTFSNNYTANQILLHTGARVFGAPGTLPKAVKVANAFVQNRFKTGDIRLTEGSGISRDNRVTARSMLQVLKAFRPHRHLLKKEGYDLFKSGTLKDISTRAGYVERGQGVLYPYVILLNSPQKSAVPVVQTLHHVLAAGP